jgi:hypothetical protein
VTQKGQKRFVTGNLLHYEGEIHLRSFAGFLEGPASLHFASCKLQLVQLRENFAVDLLLFLGRHRTPMAHQNNLR